MRAVREDAPTTTGRGVLTDDRVVLGNASARPTVRFDHTSPEFARDADAITRDLRERCPVAYTESHGGRELHGKTKARSDLGGNIVA